MVSAEWGKKGRKEGRKEKEVKGKGRDSSTVALGTHTPIRIYERFRAIANRD